MKMLLVGGGSGGHITPVLAVAEELKKQRPGLKLVYVIGKGDVLVDLPHNHPAIDSVEQVRAGKFRRYHGEGWRQLLDIVTLLKNLRDALYVCIGCLQSLNLLRRERPDVIFIKGGFVGVPVGLAAAALHIPYITHDSDAVPGLANRIIARWARKHAVAMDPQVYPYSPAKTIQVGVPVGEGYGVVTKTKRDSWRQELGIPLDAQVLCVTGGGNGSLLVNEAVTGIASELFKNNPKLFIVHITGRGKLSPVQQAYAQISDQVLLAEFVTGFYKYSGASDVIVTRAGANTLADFAMQSRACIVIPNPILTGGHQTKNAEVLAARNAIVLVTEANLKTDNRVLLSAISGLLGDPARRTLLGATLHTQSKPKAAQELAELLLQEARRRQ